jgi:hypothetical protein
VLTECTALGRGLRVKSAGVPQGILREECYRRRAVQHASPIGVRAGHQKCVARQKFLQIAGWEVLVAAQWSRFA